MSILLLLALAPVHQGGEGSQAPATADAIAAAIDARVEEKAAAAGATLAPLADDSEFLRRVTLDLTGVVPRADAVQPFLADATPGKQARAIDELLASDLYSRWYARWLLETLTERRATFDDAHNGYELLEWLRAQVAANRPYDALMRDLITASGQSNVNGATNWLLRYSVRPPDVAGALAKSMLGTSLRCAQCHDHKFRPWSQEQFWGVAAFFARTRPYYLDNDDFGVADTRFGRLTLPPGGDPDAPAPPAEVPFGAEGAAPEMAPESPALAIAPRWLDGTRAKSEEGLRGQLADFVVNDPAFARNLVNRLWAKHFGRGLVVPLDDMADAASNSEPAQPLVLLDALARLAVESRYDLRELVRGIVRSRTYQRSAMLRPLSVDQLHDSILQATGYGLDEDGSDEEDGEAESSPEPKPATAPFAAGAMMELDDAMQAQLEELYYADDVIPEFCGGAPDTLRHALTRLNSAEMQEACDSGARLAMKLFGQKIGAHHVEWVWLAFLSRPPTAEERARAEEWIAAGGGKRKALHDLVWVVLNSQEFGTNH